MEPAASISDDCLFASPRDLSTFEGCQRVHASCCAFELHWDRVLAQAVSRGRDGALATNDAALWEADLDGLAMRMYMAKKVQERAVDCGLRKMFGFGVGSVLEFRRNDGEVQLAQVLGGGLGVHEGVMQLLLTMVEPMGQIYVTAGSWLNTLNLKPGQAPDGVTIREDIRPVHASDPDVIALPREVFTADVMEPLRRKIDPRGLNNDRRSTLFAFWHETLWRNAPRSWPFADHDIVRVAKRGQPAFHVVYHTSPEADWIWCTNPKSKKEGLTQMRTKSARVELALAWSDCVPQGEYVSSELLKVFAMRETSRERAR